MSTQLEFIMQLYMMNLLQQQQQQQQQQTQQQQQQQQQLLFQQSPNKQENLCSSTGTTIALATQQQLSQQQQQQQPQQTQQHYKRTHKRKNSQNTNCSSSSSSSPNSNSISPAVNILPPPPMQQLLLNNLPPLTQLLLQQQQQQQQQQQLQQSQIQLPSSNLLLTPTTPNSMLSMKTAPMADILIGNSNCYYNLSNAFNEQQFTAGNFLQSSTVTSTPTEKVCLVQDNISTVCDDVHVVDDPKRNGLLGVPEEMSKSISGDLDKEDMQNENNVVDENAEDEQSDDEDDKPLSSLHSSSGVASTSAGSGENSSRLLACSGVQPLESADSLDSSTVPLTPIKQAADSSYSTQLPLALYKDSANISSSSHANPPADTVVDTQDTNVTPLALANAILTPPSSEQIATCKFETSETTQMQSAVTLVGGNSSGNTLTSTLTLNTAFSLDSFLQNEENLKNLKKFTSYLECENSLCRQENLREHFHCFDEPCKGKILSKKDDIIRHLKWHKKRKESLLLGFARFSSSDDCAPTYGDGCTYNWKQTHYHCVYEDCPKVYVSTSDVQMHANFHRKNSEIVQEGFRRFRAHENCKIGDCPFYGKKMSHYHCCREGCNHTFKNKADMDKHKSYHLKDYQLTQDGFKKILKTEACPFDDCKFSTVCNHIHCVREGCNYILHSSSQMISHKRKHDRQDGEQAYQQFKKQKDSSEEESPTSTQQSNTVSTPLSSLSADHFLARKRGRPPKKIQLPETLEEKRFKLECNPEQMSQQPQPQQQLNAPLLGNNIFPPFLPNFNPTAAMQSMQTQDPSAPNFQLTHLMAMFQLQNPLFYQNLYPGGMAANMANMLGAAAAASAAGTLPAQSASMLGNLAALSAAASVSVASATNSGATNIKTEFNEKASQFKE